MTATEQFAATWYAQPNDLIGGWCVMPVDQPPSCGVPEVADFITEDVARHIAGLHNAWMAGRVSVSREDLRAVVLWILSPKYGGHVPQEVIDRLAAAAGDPR